MTFLFLSSFPPFYIKVDCMISKSCIKNSHVTKGTLNIDKLCSKLIFSSLFFRLHLAGRCVTKTLKTVNLGKTKWFDIFFFLLKMIKHMYTLFSIHLFFLLALLRTNIKGVGHVVLIHVGSFQTCQTHLDVLFTHNRL